MEIVTFTIFKTDGETTGYEIGGHRLTPLEFQLFVRPVTYGEISQPEENIFGTKSYTVTGQAVFAEELFVAFREWEKVADKAAMEAYQGLAAQSDI